MYFMQAKSSYHKPAYPHSTLYKAMLKRAYGKVLPHGQLGGYLSIVLQKHPNPTKQHHKSSTTKTFNK